MDRVSKRSAAEAADALLEVGRTHPALDYDVEQGLQRHRDQLRSEAPVPEWAGAGLGMAKASQSWIAVVIKTIVSAVLVGAFATAAWQLAGRGNRQDRGLLQPSAAEVKPPSAEIAAPSVPEVAPSEAPRPLPVPEQALQRRAARAEARAPRGQRAHKEAAARVEPAAVATKEEPAPRTEAVAIAPEPKPLSAARQARPEPGSQAQAPTDLEEMKQVATAEQLLERSPQRALALAHQGDQTFAHGYFKQERAYIAIMALIKLGRIDEARARAATFGKQFPALPYGARIRSALEAATHE